MEDKMWVRSVQRGEKEYLNRIADKYYDDIYRFCLYQTGDAEESYDLTQETFLRFIRNVEQYQYKNLKGYLLTIAMNLCRDYFRRKSSEEEFNPCSFTAAESTGARENFMVLMDVMGKLSPEQREAVLLHHYYGFKFREIGAMTGSKTATVKSRVKQGIDKLARELKREDFYG